MTLQERGALEHKLALDLLGFGRTRMVRQVPTEHTLQVDMCRPIALDVWDMALASSVQVWVVDCTCSDVGRIEIVESCWKWRELFCIDD